MKRNEHEVISKLITAYEEEARLYQHVQQAASEQYAVLMNGRDPVKLAELVERQRELADNIGKIESSIEPLRQCWERMRDSLHDSTLRTRAMILDELLEQIATRIHYIIELERQNSKALLAGRVPECQ